MPTFIAFLDGKKVGEVVGLKTGEIEALIQKCVRALVLAAWFSKEREHSSANH
jgi:hypothetical protein